MKNEIKRILSFVLVFCTMFTLVAVCAPVNAAAENISVKRATVIEYMKKMSSVKWVAGKTFRSYHYYSPYNDATFHTWYGGRTYYGITYSQNPTLTNRINGKYYVTYKVFTESMSSSGKISKEIGRNDCSSSCVMSLKTVDTTINLTKSYNMRPGVNNLVAVGSYTYYSDKATTCQRNGYSKMSACYAKLKPGDLLVRDGHAMMVVHVDKENKKVTVVHQTGLNKHYFPLTDTSCGASNKYPKNSTWGVNDVMTFYYVWAGGYVPLASKTIVNDDKSNPEMLNIKKVQELQQTDATTTDITISWKKDKNAAGYKVYIFKNNEYVYVGKTKKTTFTLDRDNASIYFCKDYNIGVKAYYTDNDGETHTCIDYAFAEVGSAPSKVKNVKAKLRNGDTEVKVTWDKLERVDSYHVLRATKKNGKYKYIATVKNATSYIDEDIDIGTDYFYEVRSVNYYADEQKAKGVPSNSVKAK